MKVRVEKPLIKLGVFSTHPIQYQVPIWRGIAKCRDVQLTVFYFSDHSIRGGIDKGFNQKISWDVPMLNGYKSIFLSRISKLDQHRSMKISDSSGLIKKYKFDWILLQGYTHSFERQLLVAAKSLGVKVLMRGDFTDAGKRSWLKNIIRKYYLKWFYSNVDAFCNVGFNAKQHLLRHGVPETKIYFSPFAVDTDLFRKQKKRFKRITFRKEMGILKNDFVLIFSAKLIPLKEPLLLLEALKPLKDIRNLKLLVVGDGPLKEKVKERGKEILGDKMIFKGFVNQSTLGKYYCAADLLILPSNSETWGLVVNEAMQFNLPVIVSDQVGCRADLVKPGVTGEIFKSGNVNQLTLLIQKMLRNPQKTRQMGLKAERFVSKYTVSRAVDGIVAALGLVIKSRNND